MFDNKILMISIHAPREGGDFWFHQAYDVNKYFNPRPPRGGRPYPIILLYSSIDISIHAPREGGDRSSLRFAWRGFISIHAPREGGDDDGL